MRPHRRLPTLAAAALLALLAAALPVVPHPGAARARERGWSAPVNVSRSPIRSWFPDIAVDVTGKVHVVWCETARRRTGREDESIHYARWDGYYWSEPRDIVAAQADIRRHAIAVGAAGELLMVYNQTPIGRMGLVFSAAPLEQAWLAPAWSPPRMANAFGGTYLSDMAVDAQGTVHLLFDDWGYDPEEGRIGGDADLYYRRSTDHGHSWSVPVNLSGSTQGSSRGQLTIDPAGGLHVSWDEGWDRLSGLGEADHSAYRYSPDGGLTWSATLTVSAPTTGTAQLVSAADGAGGVLLVWRLVDAAEIHYQWTADGGREWTPPAALPGVYARPWGIPFDLYATAVDSAGHVHLLAVGRDEPELEADLRLYHLAWDGQAWSAPDVVWQGEGYPEYPRLTIAEGNHLHAVWFVRDDLWLGKTYDVWYSEREVASPRLTPAPTLTPWPTATPTPTATPLPTATPYPTLSPARGEGAPPEELTTHAEVANVLRLGVALAPIAGLLLIVAVVTRRRRRA